MAHNVVFVQSAAVALHSFEMEENKRTTRFKWPSNLIMYVQYEDGNSVVMVTEIGLYAGRILWLPWESVVTPKC